MRGIFKKFGLESFSFFYRWNYVASLRRKFVCGFPDSLTAGEILHEKRKKERLLNRGAINCRREEGFFRDLIRLGLRAARDFASSRARQSSGGAELVRRAIFLQAKRGADDNSSGYAVDAYIFGHIALLKLRCTPCARNLVTSFPDLTLSTDDVLQQRVASRHVSSYSFKERHLTFSLNDKINFERF